MYMQLCIYENIYSLNKNLVWVGECGLSQLVAGIRITITLKTTSMYTYKLQLPYASEHTNN